MQFRSPIRRHHSQRETLIGLGLNRIGKLRILPDTPANRGMILKVNHLVRVLKGSLLGELSDEAKTQLETLRRFNRRVGRVEKSGFWRRYENTIPNVISKLENFKSEAGSGPTFSFTARVDSWLEDFDQDEISAFILEYRQFTQNNDPISIANLAKIYASPWVPAGAAKSFEEARAGLTERSAAPTKIMLGDQTLMMDTLLEVVVYGGLAHANAEKAEIFENWESSGIMGFIWAEFFAYLRFLMSRLRFVRDLNTNLLALATPQAEIGPGGRLKYPLR